MHGVAGPLPEAGWGVGFCVWEPLRWERGEGGGPGGSLRTAPFKAPRSQQPGGSSRRLSWGLLCTRPGPLCPVHEAHHVQLRRRTPVAAWGGGGWRAVSSTEADRVPARAGSQALTGTSVAVNAGHAGLPWCPSWAYSGPSGQGHPARTGQLARCAEVRETPPLPLRLSGWRLGPWSGDGGATRWRGAGPPDTCGPRQGPFPWPPGLCPRPPKRTRQVSEGALAAEPRRLPPCPLGGSKRGGPLERQRASPGLPGHPSGHGRPCRWGALEGPRFGTGRPGLAGLAGLARQRSASRLPAAHLQCPLVRSLCWGGSRRIEGAEMR